MELEFCEVCENLINLEEPKVSDDGNGKIKLTSKCGSCGNIREEIITEDSTPKIFEFMEKNSKEDSIALFREESLRKVIVENFSYPRERKKCKKCGNNIAVILQHSTEIVRVYVCEKCASIIDD
jgi:DNA-directed RNA polymerase subunit M/transcription elongation factor TFIIS